MSKLWVIGGAAFLGLLLIVSVVIALLESEEILPDGSPEGRVQRFLRAVEGEEYELAYTFLSEDLKTDCAVEQFFGTNRPSFLRLGNQRVVLGDTGTIGESAFVNVRITQFHRSGPFDSGESFQEQRYILHEEDGEWRFTSYPWPFFRCGDFSPAPVRTRSEEPHDVIAPTPTPESPESKER